MSPVSRFEDLIAWQKARDVAREVARVTNAGPIRGEFRLRQELRSAAWSAMSNIAEGFERGRLTEFRQFLSIAKGSAAEVRSLLYFASDAGLIDRADYDKLMTLSLELGRILGALRSSVDRRVRSGE